MVKKFLKYLLLCCVLLMGRESSVLAENYLPFLHSGTSIVYKHWNMKKKKITGYSRLSYNRVIESDQKFIVETHEDTKPDGTIYLRKKLWFEMKTGRLTHYRQEDLRKNWSIENLYNAHAVTTNLNKDGEMTKIEQPLTTDIVPFELLMFYLKKQFAQDHFKDEKKFNLYLPATKFESELLSTTWSFVALKEKDLEMETPLGKISAIQILVTTTSDFLKWLLPESKINYRFIIAHQMPHHILAFEEQETRFILETIETSNTAQ